MDNFLFSAYGDNFDPKSLLGDVKIPHIHYWKKGDSWGLPDLEGFYHLGGLSASLSDQRDLLEDEQEKIAIDFITQNSSDILRITEHKDIEYASISIERIEHVDVDKKQNIGIVMGGSFELNKLCLEHRLHLTFRLSINYPLDEMEMDDGSIVKMTPDGSIEIVEKQNNAQDDPTSTSDPIPSSRRNDEH